MQESEHRDAYAHSGEPIKIRSANGQEALYYIRLFPASEGFDLLPALTYILGESGGAIFDGIANPVAPDMTLVGRGLAMLMLRIEERGGSALIKRLLKYTARQVPGQERPKLVAESFEEVYAGNYLELAHVLWHIAERNYAPFLPAKRDELGEKWGLLKSGLRGVLMQAMSATSGSGGDSSDDTA